MCVSEINLSFLINIGARCVNYYFSNRRAIIYIPRDNNESMKELLFNTSLLRRGDVYNYNVKLLLESFVK